MSLKIHLYLIFEWAVLFQIRKMVAVSNCLEELFESSLPGCVQQIWTVVSSGGAVSFETKSQPIKIPLW